MDVHSVEGELAQVATLRRIVRPIPFLGARKDEPQPKVADIGIVVVADELPDPAAQVGPFDKITES